MVFSLPGSGGDTGGAGDDWDRNEGDGNWEEASEKQREKVKRMVASKRRSEITDWKVSDVEEDPELFDKTGKKLTFDFPDAPPAFPSRGIGRGKRSVLEKIGARNKSERGERGKGEPGINDVMETCDEPKGEKEKNPSLDDSYEKEVDKTPREEMERKARMKMIVDRILIERKQKRQEMNKEPKGEKEKNPPRKDNNYEPKGEKEKNPPIENNETDFDKIDEKNIKPRGEKEKYHKNKLEQKEEDDLYDINFEDVELVHEYPIQGGRPPPQRKCQYEIIREQIIADRESLMRAVLADIQKTSREIVEENEKCKKRKATDEGKSNKEKKRKIEKVVDVGGARRSARERQPVSYCDLDDPDWEPEGRKKKVERKRKRRDDSNHQVKDRKPLPAGWNPKWKHIHYPFEKKNRKNGGESDKNEGKDADLVETGRRSKRAQKYVNYNFDGPRADEYVFCDKCGEDKYYGCELHPLIFDYVARFDVGPSKVGKNAGRGVFNNDFRGDIPEGVMFGPYDGIFYTPKEYKLLKKTRGESGYAWELRDPDKIKVIGYVDPGSNPDPLNQWMSIVNCASKTRHQNLMPGQFIGGIYYRSIEIIKYGEELLVYYGNDYARDIKIKVEERDLYELYEDWEEEGVTCPHCGYGFVKQEFLQKHIDRVESTKSGGCKALRLEKNKAEVLAGLRPHVCGECGKGFKEVGNLNKHKTTHINGKSFICPECGKAYKTDPGLRYHVKAEHEGQRFECPDCERPFKDKSSMMKHYKNVCNREDQEFKCGQCGRKFNTTSSMNQHIKTVHNRELPHKCEVCGQRFAVKANLQHHCITVHEGARPYVCKDCGAAFKTNCNLDHHRIRTRTLQWYWNCDVCDKKDIEMGFLLPCHLKKHMLAQHPVEYKEQIEREKPAVCPKCQKRFPSEEQVQVHLKKMHESLMKNF